MEKTYDVQTAIQWGELVQTAYDVFKADNHKLYPTADEVQFPHGYSMVANLTVDAVAGFFSEEEWIGAVVQAADDPTKFGVVIRGTVTAYDWIDDVEFRRVAFTEVPNGGMTEHGFTALYRSMKLTKPGTNEAMEWKDLFGTEAGAGLSLTVTGHSLGAAMATLAAAVLAYEYPQAQLACWTYASPRVGNADFAEAYNKLVTANFRFFNKPDLVPKVPTELLGYTHVDSGIELNSLEDPAVKHSLVCYHALVTYLHLLGSNTYGLRDCGKDGGC